MVAISAATGDGMATLFSMIERTLGHSRHHVTVLLPYTMGGMVETLHDNAQVKAVEYTPEGISVNAVLDDILYGRLKSYVTGEC